MKSLLLLPAALVCLLTGCAAATPVSTDCTYTALATLAPGASSATTGSQVQFSIASSVTTQRPAANAKCAFPQVIGAPQWTSSDPINVPISNGVPAGGAGNGVATCSGVTIVPATISVTQQAAGQTIAGATTLTCK